MPSTPFSPEELRQRQRDRQQAGPGSVDGGKLRELRRATGLKVPAFAVEVGLSPNGYRNYELGHFQPSPEALHRIASRLGREPSDLLIDTAA